MAQKNDIIRHTDIAEEGVLKPFQQELIATIQILNTMEVDLIGIAKDIKKAFSNTDKSTSKGLEEIARKATIASSAMTEHDKIVKELKRRNEQLAESFSDVSKELAGVSVELEANKRANKENAKMLSDSTGAYEKASTNLKRMIKDYKDLVVVGKARTVEAKALLSAIQLEDSALKNLDATVGQHQRNVGNYKSALNGLRGSITQITRELPAFANSFQTGFMGISNNIGPLADEIRKLKYENESLIAEGKKGVPVWQQLAGALFSWQTALSVGVTLMTVYGAKIISAIGEMLGFTKSTEGQKAAQDALNLSLDESIDKINKLLSSQQKEIDFQTQARVTNAKIAGASLEEIAKIEQEGRDKEIAKIQDALDRQNQLYLQARADLIDIKGLGIKDTEAALRREKDVVFKDAEERFKKATEEAEKLQAQLDAKVAANALAQREIIFDNQEAAKKAAEDAAKEAERRRLEALEYQHMINQATLKAMADGTIRKRLIVAEELRYEQAVNEVKIKERKKMLEINNALELEAQRKIAEIESKLNDPFEIEVNKPNLIDTRKLNAATEKARKEYNSKREKSRKEELKQEQQLINSATQILENAVKRRSEITQKGIDKEVDATKKRQEELRALALEGSQDAKDNLAFQQRKEAEIEAKRIQQEKKAARTQLFINGLKAYSANINNNPIGAEERTLAGITKMVAGLTAIFPAYYDGTEDTGPGGKVDNKKGFHAVLHPHERVVDAETNKHLSGIANNDLPALARIHKLGLIAPTAFDRTPLVKHYYDDRHIQATHELNKNVEQVLKVIEGRPVKDFRYDDVSRMAADIVITKHKTETTSRKIGGRRG